jgi:arsenite methyltransferase
MRPVPVLSPNDTSIVPQCVRPHSPPPDQSFDAVICECAFCTFPDKVAAAKEFFRVLRRGGQVGISDLTRQEVLPEELQGLLAWIPCIGDALTITGYAAFLRGAGFSVSSIKERNDALEEMANQIRLKLLGAEIMTGLNKLQLPGPDLGAAKRMANSAMTAIKRGHLASLLGPDDETQIAVPLVGEPHQWL